MYKLVLVILTLSGFLFYKAFTIKGAQKTNFKKRASLTAEAQKIPGTAIPPQQSKPLPHGLKTATAVTEPSAATAHVNTVKEDFDSLKDVYQSSEEVETGRLTQEELERHKETVELIKKIETEEAAKKNSSAGKTKRVEDLTEEEKKNFNY